MNIKSFLEKNILKVNQYEMCLLYNLEDQAIQIFLSMVTFGIFV